MDEDGVCVVESSKDDATCTETVEEETKAQISAPEIPKFKTKNIIPKPIMVLESIT